MTINIANVSLQATRVACIRAEYLRTTGKDFPGSDWFIYGLIQHVGKHECEATEDRHVLVYMCSLSYCLGGRR